MEDGFGLTAAGPDLDGACNVPPSGQDNPAAYEAADAAPDMEEPSIRRRGGDRFRFPFRSLIIEKKVKTSLRRGNKRRKRRRIWRKTETRKAAAWPWRPF